MARVGIEAGLVGEEGMKKEKEPLLLSLSLSPRLSFSVVALTRVSVVWGGDGSKARKVGEDPAVGGVKKAEGGGEIAHWLGAHCLPLFADDHS
jgi:hypothetical protein